MKQEKKTNIILNEEELLESVIRETEHKKIDGVVTGTLTGFNEQTPLIHSSYLSESCPARTLVALTAKDINSDIALMFENGNPDQPIIMGLMQEQPKKNITIFKDGKKQKIEAEKELLLKCGKSSILLKADGKIVIKGRNIISRAKETNKLRGGTVAIN